MFLFSLSTLLPPPPITTSRPRQFANCPFCPPPLLVGAIRASPLLPPLVLSLGRFPSRCIFSSWSWASPPHRVPMPAPLHPHLPSTLRAPPPASPRRPDPSVSRASVSGLSGSVCPGADEVREASAWSAELGRGGIAGKASGSRGPEAGRARLIRGRPESREQGASGWGARADECIRLQRLPAAPQPLQRVALELCPGDRRDREPSFGRERYQRNQERREREGFPGDAEAEPTEEQCRLQEKNARPQPGRSAGGPPPAACSLPRPTGWFLGVARIPSLAGIRKLFFPTFAA